MFFPVRRPFVLILFLFFPLLLCCGNPKHPGGSGSILIMSYNVLSLFDGTDSGREYGDFSVAEGTWSEKAYRQRLGNLAKVIRQAGSRSPDIVALQEIEGRTVASDLAALLASEGYCSVAVAESPGATTCILISRLPLLNARSHLPKPGLGFSGQPDPDRPILETVLDAGEGRRIIVFVNHWKSRSEGMEETEAKRIAQASLLASLVRERKAESPGAIIMACGDFNEEAEAAIQAGGAYPTAFSCLDPGGLPPSVASPILLVPESQGDAAEPSDDASLRLVSPWLESGMDGRWSYAWRSKRERIDMILFDAESLSLGGASVRDFCPASASFLLNEEGLPLAWDGRTGRGFSDHLPLLMKLELE